MNTGSLSQSNLTFSSVTFNGKEIKRKKNYCKLLQNKLEIFDELVCSFFPKVFEFLFSNLNNNDYESDQVQIKDILEDILNEYNFQWRKGAPFISSMIHELKTKIITEEKFEYLMNIIKHQEKMITRLMSKKLTTNRIEFVYNHIKNAPFYLESDLEIYELQNDCSTSITPIKVNYDSIQDIMIYDYNSNVNKGDYKRRYYF